MRPDFVYTDSCQQTVTATFTWLPWRLLTAHGWYMQTGYIDYDKLEDKAMDFRPKMLICGGSAYPREWDYKRLRQIADKVGAWLMCDMAHIRWACKLL